jgi:microcompartment protein CcmK/EutM
MQLAKVIGTVVATCKVELLTGVKLLVIQPVNSKGENDGPPIVAADSIGAGYGELVFYAKSKEGAFPLPNPNACADAGITGIIDYVFRPE